MRCCLVSWIFALVVAIGPALAAEPTGQAIYREQCARCHGTEGQGTKKHAEPLIGGKSPAQLAAYIARTMPDDDDQKCTGADAQKVAAYIYDSFYSPDAIARLHPPQVELSHLTVDQYRNCVADLIGSFRPSAKLEGEHGLRGVYATGRNIPSGKGAINRVDREVKFDFGVGGPEGASEKKAFNPHQFGIRWEGSVFAPRTGVYEFVVRTEQATRLWVNDLKKPLIDAMVKSGSDNEYRGSILLLGGRSYTIRLDFVKGKELDEKKLPKAKPTKASIELLWKRPRQADETIASGFLSPARAPEVAIMGTPFPPDDRSYGWERGAIVSREWVSATMDGALECAGYVDAHLDELAKVNEKAPDRAARLRAFCRDFAQRAFRRPLTPEEAHAYVDRQFEGTGDLDLAVKRVVLVVLNAPQFLYPGTLEGSDGYAIASRLALVLWDSLPDHLLLEAAQAGKLKTREQVVAQARRMLADPRAHAKIGSFLLSWLKVEPAPELVKDSKRFPDFDAAVASDLRTSLELFLDDIVWGDQPDFRRLLLSDQYFINPRLARFYHLPTPAVPGFVKMKLEGDRAGVLTHPYMLAALAYPAESSPIHRGVFIARGVLGVMLRPPPNAFTPLPPELHPGLTTRQRVTLQTSPDACVRCHGVINPLGFTLEKFDAVGRYRPMEKGKSVDADGGYESRSGALVTFHGAKDLAGYLAGSDEVYSAFCQQMFQYLVKQPVRAYGLERPRALEATFARDGYNVRELTVEIAVTAAMDASSTRAASGPSAR